MNKVQDVKGHNSGLPVVISLGMKDIVAISMNEFGLFVLLVFYAIFNIISIIMTVRLFMIPGYTNQY